MVIRRIDQLAVDLAKIWRSRVRIQDPPGPVTCVPTNFDGSQLALIISRVILGVLRSIVHANALEDL